MMPMTARSFHGKTILVIGATGTVGKAIVQEFAHWNCRLVLVGRRKILQEEIRAALSNLEFEYWSCDVQSFQSVRETYENILRHGLQLDIAIFSQGIGEVMDASDFSAPLFEKTIWLNLISVGYWLECLIPQMKARGRGVLVGISSLAAGRGLPRGGAYCPSKAGLSVLFECLRIDLANSGIKVILVESGFIDSPMATRLAFKPFMMKAQDAAKIIIRAIQKEKARVRFPWEMRLYAAFVRSLPIVLFDRMMGPSHSSRAPLKE